MFGRRELPDDVQVVSHLLGQLLVRQGQLSAFGVAGEVSCN